MYKYVGIYNYVGGHIYLYEHISAYIWLCWVYMHRYMGTYSDMGGDMYLYGYISVYIGLYMDACTVYLGIYGYIFGHILGMHNIWVYTAQIWLYMHMRTYCTVYTTYTYYVPRCSPIPSVVTNGTRTDIGTPPRPQT